MALDLRKPTSLKYSDYVRECAQVLDQFGDAETDCLLPHFVGIQKLADDINHAFDYNSAMQQSQLDATRVEVISKAFEKRLDQLSLSFPPSVWNNSQQSSFLFTYDQSNIQIVQISMSFHFLRIYIHEVGFHASPPSPHDLVTDQANPNAWYFSSARSESLIFCLQAAQTYLDHFIKLTPRQTSDFILPGHLRLVYAVLILGRFTTGCDCPVLDTAYVRETAKMSWYLDKLLEEADEGSKSICGTDANDMFSHLRKLWQYSKQWLAKISIDPAVVTECETRKPGLYFMDILSSAGEKCVEPSGITGQYDERWCDMLDWGPDMSVPEL